MENINRNQAAENSEDEMKFFEVEGSQDESTKKRQRFYDEAVERIQREIYRKTDPKVYLFGEKGEWAFWLGLRDS